MPFWRPRSPESIWMPAPEYCDDYQNAMAPGGVRLRDGVWRWL
jgi:hypothetical protein